MANRSHVIHRLAATAFPLLRRPALWLGLGLGLVDLCAHDPGLSTLHIVSRPGGAEFILQFAPADAAQLAPLDANGDGRVTREEFETARPGLEPAVSRWVSVHSAAGAPPPFRPMSAQLEENADNVLYRAWLPFAPEGEWRLVFPQFLRLPPGHRHLVTVTDAGGHILAEQMIEATVPFFAIPWTAAPARAPVPAGGAAPPAEPAAPSSFTAFLKLGVEHILIGYDHLLFLAGLLLVCRRFGEMVGIVTSFTLAHSLTLVLATFDLITLPGRIVEPLIAASIVYVGVENLARLGEPPKARWLLTFIFGLVHGLGFAGVLRELGLGEAGRAVLAPLVGFNLGVELGQLVVASLLLPALLIARRQPWFERRALPALSGLVALIGLFWLLQRTL